jgi:hypothetical protein
VRLVLSISAARWCLDLSSPCGMRCSLCYSYWVGQAHFSCPAVSLCLWIVPGIPARSSACCCCCRHPHVLGCQIDFLLSCCVLVLGTPACRSTQAPLPATPHAPGSDQCDQESEGPPVGDGTSCTYACTTSMCEMGYDVLGDLGCVDAL